VWPTKLRKEKGQIYLMRAAAKTEKKWGRIYFPLDE